MESTRFLQRWWRDIVFSSMQVPENKTSHTHSSYERSINERTIQYVKDDRTQNVLMIIFPAENLTIN